ncbi:hypothetical protein AgCh_022706 [Apium graveolens]
MAPPPPPPPPPPELKPEPKPEPAPGPPPPHNGRPPCRCCSYDTGGDMEYMYGMHNLRSIEMNKTYRFNFWDDYNNDDYYYGTRQMGIYYPDNSHGYHSREVFALPPRAPRRALPQPHDSHFHVPHYGAQMAAVPQCHYPPPLPPPRRRSHQFALPPPPPAHNHYAPSHHRDDDYYASAVCYYY